VTVNYRKFGNCAATLPQQGHVRTTNNSVLTQYNYSTITSIEENINTPLNLISELNIFVTAADVAKVRQGAEPGLPLFPHGLPLSVHLNEEILIKSQGLFTKFSKLIQ
jgi:hypothetical protein